MRRWGDGVKIVPFEMERWQSTWENTVDFNLSESGVQPIPLRELLRDETTTQRFLDHPLAYSQGNGTPELRSKIADLYRDATPSHVLVTNGSSEGNLLAMWHLVEKGDEIVVMLPNYMENWGLVQIFGGTVKPLPLREDRKWQFDPDELSSVVTRKTKAIAICNPDNPTGAVMGDAQRRAILDAARDSGAWLLSDEVYLGAEREGPRTETAWGEYERTLIVNGLSKAYGLPGLRIGWIVGPPETIATLWGYHDYTTLAPTYLSDRLAQIALSPERREEILARTRSILQRNYAILGAWIRDHGALFSHVPPTAGAICFLRYALRINSSELAWRLLKEKSTLIVPGDQFGMDGFIRIGMGDAPAYLTHGLERIDAVLREIRAEKGKA
ncbi:MAG: aminotransferase class I/II-fold pyridoxal phosphate-dependent enzyme [Candidatus Eisenbacteria bacterium]|uniref:Aminotransferase n=1 Tax=Eiseniibacteriota bacterium TaxID=2212470 RepID=A0A538SJI4_UNCEI|nr:MAG: aminotransferase class I/II-fold pyridoxal phosphate-dependent enzyme [Candidatus Eisenbacteria bacterium]